MRMDDYVREVHATARMLKTVYPQRYGDDIYEEAIQFVTGVNDALCKMVKEMNYNPFQTGIID